MTICTFSLLHPVFLHQILWWEDTFGKLEGSQGRGESYHGKELDKIKQKMSQTVGRKLFTNYQERIFFF